MRSLTRIIATLTLALAPLMAAAEDIRTVVLAGGCFWCVEADFDKVEGVIGTVSGFSGGTSENPTYRQVVSGGTGHLEAVEITYDADVVTYTQLVHMFLRSIDPLDAGGQFCDRGEPYTTAIFAETDEERTSAQAALSEAQAALGQPLATTLRDRSAFYPAGNKHQNFYKKSPLRYGTYRKGCGRDRRVKDIWGDAAAFAKTS